MLLLNAILVQDTPPALEIARHAQHVTVKAENMAPLGSLLAATCRVLACLVPAHGADGGLLRWLLVLCDLDAQRASAEPAADEQFAARWFDQVWAALSPPGSARLCFWAKVPTLIVCRHGRWWTVSDGPAVCVN